MSAINLDKAYCLINENEIKIIKRTQKPMLYHNGCLWKKKTKNNNTVFDIKDIRIYRDDSIIHLRKTKSQKSKLIEKGTY